MRAGSAVSVVALALALTPAAVAEELRFDPARDGMITAGAGLLWLANELYLEAKLSPTECRWCDDNGFDRAVRDGLVWDDRGRAATLSDIGAYLVAPGAAIGVTAAVAGLDGRFADNVLTDTGLVLEATFVAAAVTQLAKQLAGRQRPFVGDLTPEERAADGNADEHYLSYYSGHTSFAFSLAAASGTVASLRGYRHAWAVWAIGMTTATATGYLRIAADKHYATDVLTGAAMGSAFGVLMPMWLGRTGDGLTAEVTPQGATLGLRGRF